MRACTCTRVIRAYAHRYNYHAPAPGQSAWLEGWCESPEQGRYKGEVTRGCGGERSGQSGREAERLRVVRFAPNLP